MFEKLKKINIKGGCFDEDTELELFRNDALTVMYGRNGSGKTTIAHCIKKLAVKVEDRYFTKGEDNYAEFTVKSQAAIGEEHKEQVFVFDEDFVTEQIRFRKNGIQTIVMMGEQAEIDKEMEACESSLIALEEQIDELTIQQLQYRDMDNDLSPVYHFNKLYEAMRADGGWAEIEGIIRGNKIKSKVTASMVDALLAIDEPTESYEELHAQLLHDKELYLQSQNAEPVEWEGVMPDYPMTLNELCALLQTPIDKPELTLREQRLLSFMAAHPHEDIWKMKDERWEFCPLCLRPMDEHDYAQLSATLTKLLNRQADEYREQLADARGQYGPMAVSLPNFPGNLYQKELADARTALDELNQVALMVRDTIDKRSINVYEAMTHPFSDEFLARYERAVQQTHQTVTLLNERIAEFNKTVAERKKLRDKTLFENRQLVRKQLAPALEVYRKAKNESNAVDDRLSQTERARAGLNVKMNALKERKKRTDIALDYINQELSYVFYSDRKLQLVAGDDNNYLLKVNGRNVTPNKISVGERNVLALCYFFARLYNNKSSGDQYKTESLVVIDDPVSSFDYGNRLGVMTLLRYQFSRILKGNPNSRILVMSHDLYSVFDLVKIKNDVCGPSQNKDERRGYLALEDRKLKPATMRNEYSILLKHVFAYADSKEQEDPDEMQEMAIGNVMRRLLEGYASFCYNKKFEEMLRMDELLNGITPGEKRDYYGNFMFRLALNGESHVEEGIYALNGFNRYFPRDEKVKTAKTLLLFLSYINPLHLASYLSPQELQTLATWRNNEAGWIKEFKASQK